MSDSSQTAHEFIQDAFSPQVAVLCSHDAELICKKNNLTFVELTKPFCRLKTEAQIRDPNGVSHTVRHLAVSMRDMESGPPQPPLARKMLSDAVANALPMNFDLKNHRVTQYGMFDLQLSASCPWFEAYRECFLQVLYPSDHEFHKHHLACIFVVSSSQPEPLEQFTQLTQLQNTRQHQQPNMLPKWFCPNILRYYVLLHDVSHESEARAESIYQTMKNTYGTHSCHLLQINSRPPASSPDSAQEQGIPDPWSKFLSTPATATEKQSTSDSGDKMTNDYAGQTHTEQGTSEGNQIHPLSDPSTQLNTDPISPHPLQDNAHPLQTSSQHVTENHVTANSPVTSPAEAGSGGAAGVLGGCLSLSDHDRLRIFIHEFMVRGLIPWAERLLKTINEQVLTRKGMGRSILSGAKKWFGTNKPAPQHQLVEKPNVVYTLEAPEMQMRRQADLCFMFQLYDSAYQTYHQCKRDFSNDHAWLHYAGAMEMAGLSVLMQGGSGQRQYPAHYMEQAVSTYLNTCKQANLATRATLFNCEALKSKHLFREAAAQYMKINNEDSDLRSALLLEQTAHCFLRQQMPRKYAFNMILAGHRYNKAMQRRHALRSYSQALQTYEARDWSLALDHIQLTVGRQCVNLKQLDAAVQAFSSLFLDSKQPAPQQGAFLREYLHVYKQLESERSDETEVPELPLPQVLSNATQVLVCHPHSAKEGRLSASSCSITSAEDASAPWCKLEQLALVSAHGSAPLIPRTSEQCYSARTDNKHRPAAVINELLTVCVHLVNPLRVALLLGNVSLLWRFLPVHYDDEDTSSHVLSNERHLAHKASIRPTEVVETQCIPEISLQPLEKKKVVLTLRPTRTGQLHVTGLDYRLSAQSTDSQPSVDMSVRGKLRLECQGPRLNNTKPQKQGRMYGPDQRLHLDVVPAMPRLEVHFCDLPPSMLQGELRRVRVELSNTGSAPLTRLKMAAACPHVFTFSRHPSSTHPSPTHSPARQSSEGTSVDFDNHAPVDSSSSQTVLTSSSHNVLTSSSQDSSSTSSSSNLATVQGASLSSNKTQASSSDCVIKKPQVRHVEEVPLDSAVLGPGETAVVQMWVCAPSRFGEEEGGGGVGMKREYETHLLFYYEPKSKHPKSKLRHRVLRHTVQMQIRPALLLRATAARRNHCASRDSQPHDVTPRHDAPANQDSLNFPSSKSLLISLSVQNLNNDEAWAGFRVTRVTAVSDVWSVQRLTHHDDDAVIGRGESALTMFEAGQSARAPVPHSSAITSTQSFTSNKSQVIAHAPSIDFYFRHAQHKALAEVEVESPKAALQMDEAEPTLTSRVRDMNSLRLSLVVEWQACLNDGSGLGYVLQGQHQVTLNEIDTVAYSSPPQVKQLEQPPVKFTASPDPAVQPPLSDTHLQRLLRYTLHYPRHVTHDFTRNRLCVVRVAVWCHNLSAAPLSLQIHTGLSTRCEQNGKDTSANETTNNTSRDANNPTEAVPTQSIAQQDVVNTPSSASTPPRALGSLLWSGAQVTCCQVARDSSTRVHLTACVRAPGVYNLASLEVKAAPSCDLDGVTYPMTLQKSHAPCLIVVSDCNLSPEG